MESGSGLLDNKAVGKRIRQIRESNKLTQEQMAEVLGVNPNAVRAYERGEYGISKEVMARIRQRFHVSIDYLLFGPNDDWENLLVQVRNAQEEEKMKLMLHLMFYFVKEKEQCFQQDTSEEEIVGNIRRMFEEI